MMRRKASPSFYPPTPMSNNKTIIFAGGGSGGPVTPLLAVASVIRKSHPGWSLLWIGTSSGPEKEMVTRQKLSFKSVPAGKLRRYWSWRNFLTPLEVAAGFFAALILMLRHRPSVVVSAGGFVAVPVIWAARLVGARVHIHQQDLRPTLTNKLTAPLADTVSVAFEKSLADFAKWHPTLTGNPVRSEILAGSREAAAREFSLDPDRPTVLVVGGGTGAVRLNELTAAAVPKLIDITQVIHATGRGKCCNVTVMPGYRQRELILGSEMPDALALADLVVTRAGIGTLSELATLGKPAVIVPMHGTHQEDNARYFSERGAGMYLDETKITGETFYELISGLLSDGGWLRECKEAMLRMNDSYAAGKVAEIVVGHANGNNR